MASVAKEAPGFFGFRVEALPTKIASLNQNILKIEAANLLFETLQCDVLYRFCSSQTHPKTQNDTPLAALSQHLLRITATADAQLIQHLGRNS